MPCQVPSCPRPLDPLVGGSLCNLHRKRLTRNGSLEFIPLTSLERLPYIMAASALLPPGLIGEMQQVLDSLPFVDQRNVRGLSPTEKAKAILVNIQRQRGADAAKLILAAGIGAECCPKLCANERYRKVQVARSVFHLLRSQEFELFGQRVVYRISLQGGRTSLSLCDMLEAITYFWTKDHRQRIVDVVKSSAH